MKHCIISRAGSFRILAKAIFPQAMLTFALCCVALPAAGATRIWLGANSLWSNPNNWSPGGVPQNGDALTFPSGNQFTEFFMNNDLVW